MDIKNYQTAIEPAIREAGKLLRNKFATFARTDARIKAAHELVTDADLASEQLIVAAIRQHFPDQAILSEEAGEDHKDSDWLWIIDPLDGTTNFSFHNPIWSISVALAYRQQIVLGMIYAPQLEEFFVARAGEGAWLNDKPLVVSSISSGKVIHAFCHGYQAADIERAVKYFSYQKLNNFDCRQLGSAALELAFVAAGRMESITIPGGRLWDAAAGVALVREAKGRVSDWQGQDWTMRSKDLLASNNLVHEQILEVIKNL